MKVAVTGASGFIGSALMSHLSKVGHQPIAWGRGEGAGHWDPRIGHFDPDLTEGVEAVVHLAGESIGGRWTNDKKERILRSRVDGTALIARAVADSPIETLVVGSAIGWYGDRGDEELDETKPVGEGFLAEVVHRWEEAAASASGSSRVVLARTSLVLDRAGGSFPRMLLPFRLGGGGPIGSGRQWWAWIGLEDEVRAITHCLENQSLEGPVNLAAPQAVRNADFGKTLGKALHRPAILPTPALALKVLLGAEFAREVLLASQRVIPTRLGASGFHWNHPTLGEALAAIL